MKEKCSEMHPSLLLRFTGTLSWVVIGCYLIIAIVPAVFINSDVQITVALDFTIFILFGLPLDSVVYQIQQISCKLHEVCWTGSYTGWFYCSCKLLHSLYIIIIIIHVQVNMWKWVSIMSFSICTNVSIYLDFKHRTQNHQNHFILR